MQKTITLPRWFFSMEKIFSFAKKTKSKSLDQSKLLLHTIQTLSLSNFIECFISNDYTKLIIEGSLNKTELQKAWDVILFEYYELLGSNESKSYFIANKEIYSLLQRMDLIILSVNIYLETRDDRLKKIIANYGLHFQSVATNEQIIKQCEAHLKYIGLELKKKQASLEDLTKKNNSKVEITRADFISNIAALGKHYGYAIDITKTTIETYCIMQRDFNNYVTKQIELTKNGTNRFNK